MRIIEIIKGRRSIREYQNKEISEEIVDLLIESLIWAPSAGNLQSRFFYFVFNEEIKERLVDAALGQRFISQAPLAIVACTDSRIMAGYGTRGRDLYSIQDVAASIQNLLLEVYELGLGGVWVGAFREEMVKGVLDIPDNLRPVAIIPIGYPGESPTPPSRISRDMAIRIIR